MCDVGNSKIKTPGEKFPFEKLKLSTYVCFLTLFFVKKIKKNDQIIKCQIMFSNFVLWEFKIEIYLFDIIRDLPELLMCTRPGTGKEIWTDKGIWKKIFTVVSEYTA